MMRRTAALAAAIAMAVAFSQSSTSHAATSLDELLDQTRSARQAREQTDAAREKEFLANRDHQATLLADANRARDDAEARSKATSEQFDANERTLAEKQDLLNQRLGSLGELFGVVRQVAGDTTPLMYSSLVSAQIPKRDEFLATLARSKELPSIDQLERMWFELQREMTESGRVVRFQTPVTGADGTARNAEVVRVGPFVAMSNGQYLNFMPSLGTLAVLPRQPAASLVDLAMKIQHTTGGYTEAAIDPSRGALLSMLVQRPTVIERIRKGQEVGYLIIAVGLIGLALAIYQAIYLLAVRSRVRRQLADIASPAADNPLGRVLGAVRTSPSTIEEDAEVVELRVSEAVLREVPRLERFQAFLRLAVAAGPLLGLIGTVIGMIITFQSITESGSSDPRLMANGIGQAMIATVLGLGVAIPLLFLNAGLSSLSRAIVQILDEQSTGLLAESLERARGPRHA
ncbi:MAG TPA: MotA/TolQ/ExbB proton channel family protein [Candidatus Binatia bacterium]|jgi:biopolymer transport protein ExbB